MTPDKARTNRKMQSTGYGRKKASMYPILTQAQGAYAPGEVCGDLPAGSAHVCGHLRIIDQTRFRIPTRLISRTLPDALLDRVR